MKKLILALCLLFTTSLAHATTWYVRTNGGNRTQCTGQADADYSGTGSAQACAFKDPRYLWSPGDSTAYAWLIAGGDTVIVRGGPWLVGRTDAGTFSNQAASDNSYMPSIPSGTASAHTRILGENYAACGTAQTQLWGGQTQNAIINIQGSSYVDVQCIEMTDHSQCAKFASKPIPCTGDIGDYANWGVFSNKQSHDINLIDDNIHGLMQYGWYGATAGNLTILRTKINFNTQGGMSFDDGNASSGQVTMSYSQVNGNGCIEEYPIVHQPWSAANCYDDSNPAYYGDAIGLTYSDMTWQVDHTEGAYNTQDMDWKYIWGSGSTGLFFDNWFHDNMGNQLKFGAAATSWTIYNNLLGGDCVRMSRSMIGAPWGGISGPPWGLTHITSENPGWNTTLNDFCRAPGLAVFTLLGDNSTETRGTYTFVHNTVYGYGVNGMFQAGNCSDTNVNNNGYTSDCNTPTVVLQNNLFVGYTMGNGYTGAASALGGQGGVTSIQPAGTTPYKTQDHNLFYGSDTPAGTGNVFGQDPLLIGETSIAAVPIAPLGDFVTGIVQAGSAAIGQGTYLSAYATDALGNPRSTTAPTIGAFEYIAPASVTGLESQTFLQPGNVGDTGGGGSGSCTGTYTQTAGSPGTFAITPCGAYDDGYWYYQLGAHDAMTNFTYSLQVDYPTAADLAASQALEFEMEQTVGNKIYNMGIQCDFSHWNTFNYTSSTWVSTGFACSRSTFAAGTYVPIVATYTRNASASTITFNTLTVAGTTMALNVTNAGFAKTQADKLNVGFQLDSNSAATAYKVYVKGMNVAMTQPPLPVVGGIPTGAINIGSVSVTSSALSCSLSGTTCVSPSWKSSNTKVATVNSSGSLVPLSSGNTNITVTVGGITSVPFPVQVVNALVLIHAASVTH